MAELKLNEQEGRQALNQKTERNGHMCPWVSALLKFQDIPLAAWSTLQSSPPYSLAPGGHSHKNISGWRGSYAIARAPNLNKPKPR